MITPSATYRVQLNDHFTFKQLKEIIPYLHQLGISTIYASPVTQAIKGSAHGYDVINPLQLNSEIGTEREWEEITHLLQQYSMNWLQDIVPNHTAFDLHNHWLHDVLESGWQSDYFSFFDIDWDYPDPFLNGKLMTPFLGKEIKKCVAEKEIKLSFDENGFALNYYDYHFPIAINSYELIPDSLDSSKSFPELIKELTAQIQLPAREWQQHKKGWIKKILGDDKAARYLQQQIKNINNRPELLQALLQQQHYALAYWKRSNYEINYRRFFTVNSLICLRMEDENVFTAYHRWLHDIYQRGWINGLRIDHIDGLYNPREYISRVKNVFGKSCYLVAEKILAADEKIPPDWDLEGTTGYDFLAMANQLFTDKNGAQQLINYYRELTAEKRSYEKIVFDNKINFLKNQMRGELENLWRLVVATDLFENINPEKLKEALAVLLSSFPVYRIYPENFPLNEEDKKIINIAFETANKNETSLAAELKLLEKLFEENVDVQKNNLRLQFIKRLAQYTAPLAAKGVEDTTFYNYIPLLANNEVGDAPGIQGISIKAFHEKMITRQLHFPLSMNATSTHDTKRGEGARIRLNILSAMPDEWCAAVNVWREMNAVFIQQLKNKKAPAVIDEYLIYQSLLSGFPDDLKVNKEFTERLKQYIIKALREAKTFTNWTAPDEEYENACMDFIEKILNPRHSFLESFIAIMKKIITQAHVFSLSQTLIKITAPGIPDIYQGSELWNFSYVDPDNRRQVDYSLCQDFLKKITTEENKEELLSFISQHKREGAQKLYLLQQALNFRKKYPDLFIHGEYIPLSFPGENGLTYARKYQKKYALIIVPLNRKNKNSETLGNASVQVPEGWPRIWENEFTGENYVVEDAVLLLQILKKFPVALLFGRTD